MTKSIKEISDSSVTHGISLYVRDGNRLVTASADDMAVVNAYPAFQDKGRVFDGIRLTLMSSKESYSVRESVHVIHVVEFVASGFTVYVMGPKRVYGEYVDGQLMTEPLPENSDPLSPLDYDGVTLPSPALDFNYEITTYYLSPGIHEICWRLNHRHSNILKIRVIEGPDASNAGT